MLYNDKGEQRMNRNSGITLLAALAVLGLVAATSANASVVEFRFMVGGVDVANYTGAVDSTFSLSVQVRTDARYINNETQGAYIAGITQAAFQIQDSLGITTTTGMSPSTLAGPPIVWNSSVSGIGAPSYGYSQTRGQANVTPANGTYKDIPLDVLAAKVNVAADYWAQSDKDLWEDGSEYGLGNTFGGAMAQPYNTQWGTWTTIIKGNYTYKGGTGALTLLVDASQQTIWNGATGSVFATGVVGDTLTFGAVIPTVTITTPDVAEGDWTQEPGWKNPLHTVSIAVNSTNATSFVWKLTNPNAGGTTETLPYTTEDIELTMADIMAAFGTQVPLAGGIEDYNYDWTLQVTVNGGTVSDSISVFVPEPATMGLLAFGVVGLLKRRRRA